MVGFMPPPELLFLNDFEGTWTDYEEGLYSVFHSDILQHDLRFRGSKVTARRTPEHKRKWACFWHLISEGRVEDDRMPDLRRCERIAWIRWIIENEAECADIEVWTNQRGREHNTLLWYREEYLIILSRRSRNLLLKTAYCTNSNHRIRKLRKERDG